MVGTGRLFQSIDLRGERLVLGAGARVSDLHSLIPSSIPEFTLLLYQIAEIFTWRSKKDKAFEWLERAYKATDGGLSHVKGDPVLRGRCMLIPDVQRHTADIVDTHGDASELRNGVAPVRVDGSLAMETKWKKSPHDPDANRT